MRRLFTLSLVLLLAGVVAASEKVTLKGYVIDNACSSRAHGEGGIEKVKTHTVKCATAPACAKSGYAFVTEDGKVYKLDEAGNKKVAEMLASTKSEKSPLVTVEGMLDGETLKVTSLSEAKM